MVDIEELKQEIITRLQPLDPERIVLFGSYAHGSPTEDSDIDLYIVTRDDFVPATYHEKRDLVRKISRAIFDLRMQVSIDLLVHTKKMSEQFFQKDGSFARTILKTGVVWYE
ncbi:nucleotidyltransferase domain-containing protein [Candidatus Parcubacteria bacterium]|nr:MAG: nucleotidyltransferase domain-containing protein [Candidatus Parcubacteria bacterium]